MDFKLADVKAQYNQNKELKEEDVKALLEWAEKQRHLPKLNELQAILFLHSCYNRNEEAKKAIDNFFTLRTLYKDLFGNRKPESSDMRAIFDTILILTLPKKTPKGYTITFGKLIDLNPDNYVFPLLIRYSDIVSMLNLYQNGISEGHVMIIDFYGFTFTHLTKIGLHTARKYLYYFEEALPIRAKEIHLINATSVMEKLVSALKPFMTTGVVNMMNVHKGLEGLDEYVPTECLPRDLGGFAEPTSILHKKLKEKLVENSQLFAWEDTLTVDESKRLGKSINFENVFGTDGTFKKLEVD